MRLTLNSVPMKAAKPLDNTRLPYYDACMTRSKKGELERIADMILLDDAIKEGYVKGTGNKHGFGKYMRERGMLNAAWESEINSVEKTGFDEGQLDELGRTGPDRRTRERYKDVK